MTRARKKSPKQLNKEISSSLAARGEPTLAAIFADPEARQVFAQEMRHQINLKKTAASHASALVERPYTVKRIITINTVDGPRLGRDLIGNFKTMEDAIARADQLGGWVESRSNGDLLYGVRKDM